MFKEKKLEIFEDVKLNSNRFLEEGLALISKNKDKSTNDINFLRDQLEIEFKKNNYPMQIHLDEICEIPIKETIQGIFNSKELKEFFCSLSSHLGDSEVTLFPHIHVMRNYYPCPYYGYHGWHNDTLGERPYEFCLKRLKSDNYMFGKVSIALQKNTCLGGNIDISTIKFNRKGKISLRQKISNQIQARFLKLFKKRLPLALVSELIDMWLSDLFSLLTKPNKINPCPLDMIAFHSQLFHRGTPLSPKGWNEIISKYPNAEVLKTGLPKEINLKDNNKYIIYAHFGNKIGLESYVFDRSRRPRWSNCKGWNERNCWFEQYELDIFKNHFPSSRKIFESVLSECELV